MVHRYKRCPNSEKGPWIFNGKDRGMIKRFKLFADKGKVSLALLEYGEDNVTFEQISEELARNEVEEFDENAVRKALSENVASVIVIKELKEDEGLLRFAGACWITIDDLNNAAKVNIYPPIGTGKTINETDIIVELKLSGCGEYYILNDILRRNLENFKKTPSKAIFKIAERRNAILKVEISEDRRTAYLSYTEPFGGDRPSFDETLKKINEAKVVFGINEDRIKEILEKNEFVSKQRIAGAREAENGTDGSIEYLFDAFQKNVGPFIREDGSVDFRDIDLFENVDEDTPLVRKTPPTLGVDGTDVAGKPIKAVPGKEAPLPKGKNTRTDNNDHNLLVAAKPGTPKLQHGKVVVDDVLVVDDVDFSTGNIDFNGSVVVKGIVNTGFSISATGDITCSDTVEGATLYAGGNILLKRGIKGLRKSRIEAEGDIFARFIEMCIVEAGGSVIVDEALIHSTTSAGDTIEVTHSKGSIFGGNINAGKLVSASLIGSEMAITTIIEVGASPQTRKRLEKLNGDMKRNKKELDMGSKNLKMLKTLRSRSPLPPDREELYMELVTKTSDLKAAIEQATETISMLQKDLQHSAEGRIEAKKTIFPGVTMSIKDIKRQIREPMEKAVFFKEGAEILTPEEMPKE